MVKRTRELRPHIQVAAVAKFRRGFLQQVFAFLCMMRRMAVNACDATLQVEGAAIVALFVAALVAIQAAGADLLRARRP